MVYKIEKQFMITGIDDQDTYLIYRCMSEVLNNPETMLKFDTHERPVMERICESMRNMSNHKTSEVNEMMWWNVLMTNIKSNKKEKPTL